ncbi:hypothetical protein [Burkholderia vietnamiensis]|uniref:hypothetical protein n=1 Tax=Burkholderia vietnamiensis TaxID=60552 RepID=UPI001CF3A7BD|nr:hypothetical protein [Burkholderia vietnamiensis]MCA8451765.1 hypothetical protein [Burkholderia vietnamiensis]HDR8951137.1 hypothetical protein [Burkholderia vietnamiensis]
MITQQKFIYSYLYWCPDTTASGSFLLSVERAAADLSMTASSLDDALDEFVRRGLIARDKVTGEIFVLDWPRWHRFATPAARGALWASIARIQSDVLRAKVESSYKSIPLPGKGKDKEKGKASSNEEEPSGKGIRLRSNVAPWRTSAGIRCWTDDDKREAEALERRYGERTRSAVAKLEDEDIEPLPSRVAALLKCGGTRLPAGWRDTEAATIAAARVLGLEANRGEFMEEFRRRIEQEVHRRGAI